MMKNMVNSEIEKLRDLYGLNPDISPLALQFPRLPPGLRDSPNNFIKNPMKEKFLKDSMSLTGDLSKYQSLYQKYASGLLEMSNPGVVPPGHPAYSQKHSIDGLKNKNMKLEKENLELKKQIEKLSKNKTN